MSYDATVTVKREEMEKKPFEWVFDSAYTARRKVIKRLRSLWWPPVFIFQMGKVGSATLRATLSGPYKGRILYAHNFKELSEKEIRILEFRRRFELPVKVISPVRDPISRNVSSFFQNFTRNTEKQIDAIDWDPEDLRSLFLEKGHHDTGIHWFDRVFQPALGLDVLSQPFPIEKKWAIYKKGNIQLLVYRTDLAHSDQLSLVSGFVGCALKAFAYTNRSDDKKYREFYRRFVDTVVLPEEYISRMCDSAYFRHFWSDDEIRSISERWRDQGSP